MRSHSHRRRRGARTLEPLVIVLAFAATAYLVFKALEAWDALPRLLRAIAGAE